MSRKLGPGRFILGFSILAAVLGGAGCANDVIVEPVPYGFVADLEVTWGIAGIDDPFYCDLYGIDQWVVQADGPESRQSVIDCRANIWSSEADFFAIAEGFYVISVSALSGGAIIATQALDYELIDTGGVQPLFFDFQPGDFGFVF